jgi:hypothetical protein
VVAVDAALTAIVLLVGALSSRLSPRSSVVRVHRDRSRGGFATVHACWQGPAVLEPAAARSIGTRGCAHPARAEGARLRERRDAGRGLWIVDLGDRHTSAAFTDRGARVGPTYASILSSAALPASPYRAGRAFAEPVDAARLREAFALTICALNAAPLAASFLRALVG